MENEKRDRMSEVRIRKADLWLVLLISDVCPLISDFVPFWPNSLQPNSLSSSFRQMLAAIFMAAGRDAKIKVGMAGFGASAGLAAVKCLQRFFPGFAEKDRSGKAGFASVERREMRQQIAVKEKEEIQEGGSERGCDHGRLSQRGEDHQDGADEGQPGDPHRDDKEEKHREIGIDGGEGEQEGEVEKGVAIGQRDAGTGQSEGEGDKRAGSHTAQVEKGEFGGADGAFQSVAEVEEDEEGKEEPEGAERFRNEDPGSEPPDLALQDKTGVKCQNADESRNQEVQNKNKGIEEHHIADESGDGAPLQGAADIF